MEELCFTPNKVAVGRRRLFGHVHTLVPRNWSLLCCQEQGMQPGVAVRWWGDVFAAGEQDFFTHFHLEQGLFPIYCVNVRWPGPWKCVVKHPLA